MDTVAGIAYGKHHRSSTRASRHVILLVDDNYDANAALERFLHLHHFEVVVAFDGVQALERLRAEPTPSLILLDVMMPGADGHAFRAAQRADPALAAIPVIVLSGGYDVGSIAEQLGVRTFLTKPVDAQRLLDAIRRCSVANRHREATDAATGRR